MTVKIEIYAETAEDALHQLSALSAGAARLTRPAEFGASYGGPETGSGEQTAEKRETIEVPEGTAAVRDDEGKATGAIRKRGEPSPGKARRTKAEIAEDEAAEQAEAKSNISTNPEDRIDPENPPAEDDSETQAQDAADEAAEAESADLTIDDVKAVVNDYVAAYGMPAVQEDGPAIFKEALGAPPEGEKFWKFSILPTDQPSLKKLASVWRRAVDENPLKRERVS